MTATSLAQSLDKARKELLDLGLRNSLINYRAPKTRGAEVVNAKSSAVFDALVREARELTFGFVEEPGSRSGSSGDLMTRLSDKSLQTRLLATYHAARAHIEERGSNILFLALGMLHWFEDDRSQKELRAPLLLIPVQLERSSARDRFKLAYNGEDIDDNLSLATKLKTEFHVTYPPLPEVEDLDVDRYFIALGSAVEGMTRWRVTPDEISLGFFSFGKFLMYRDLAPEGWINEEQPDGPALLTALLGAGFKQDPSPVGEDDYIDEHISPDSLHQVVDLDSSQALAMLDIRSGRSMVIQGPPGTGKSQTITNVLADALGQGKKVLFVAEKMAALEVVKRRLDKAGIGDACLELHSHTINKKAVLADLKRTMDLGKPQLSGSHFSLSQYKLLRDQLNEFCEAVNVPVGESGYTPFQLMGELVGIREALGGIVPPRVANEALPAALTDRETVDRLLVPVLGLERHLAKLGVPARHPFAGSQLQALLPSDRHELEQSLDDLLGAATSLRQAVAELSAFMGIEVRIDQSDAQVLVSAGKRALSAPHLHDVQINTRTWQEKRDEIEELLAGGEGLSNIHSEIGTLLVPEAWTADVLAARQVLRTIGGKWWRWASGSYRGVRAQIGGLCAGEPVLDVAGQLRIVEAVLQAARLRKVVEEHGNLGKQLFGVQWQGVKSDWGVLRRINTWIVDLYRSIGERQVPPGVVDFLAGNPALDRLRAHVDALEAAIPAFAEALPRVAELLALDDSRAEALRGQSLDDQISTAGAWRRELPRLPDWITYNNATGTLHKAGPSWLVRASYDWEHGAQHLADFYEYVELERLLRAAHREREALRTFSSASQEQVREEFASLDRACFKATQLDLATRHWKGLPNGSAQGQIGVLRREFEKKTRHMPIRKLVLNAGRAIQAIKPVFMMSPMSVASFLPPGTLSFDLVVFDEASQVKPVDAFGAVMRGSQLVVVGDSKQLPPTSFFDSLAADGDAEDDDDAVTTSDMESILGLVAGQGAPQRMLRWHYRSRHESLIALSNKEFYDSRLVVFPSPEATRRGLGLRFHHLVDAPYDRGRSRTNRKEAEAVAKAVMEHAHHTPHLTLGVAAFSLSQADAILDELERLRRADSVAEPFFDRHPFEPFFVKNLESVQGDERDMIFISVGYGKDANGYAAMSFGALNGDGGERRLNVLISRARLSCEVFSNLTHDDIDVARTQARGVIALKAYLKYAATGVLDVPDAGRAEQDSVFEEEVAAALERSGHQVRAQVGSGGFRIDLAVVDPRTPGRYLIGIECDGATYHSSRSARDRDRLRQQVLENLGWRIHRIWSTDWFNDPAGELRRALAAIEAASAAVPAPASPKEAPESEDQLLTRDEGMEKAQEGATTPYVLASPAVRLGGVELHELAPSVVARWVADIAKVEGPVHHREVMRRIAESAGVKRIGSRIEAALMAGIEGASRLSSINVRGDFIWPLGLDKPAVRDRSALPPTSRKLELVAPEEVRAAVLLVIDVSYGIPADDVPAAVCRLLGFARTTDEMSRTVLQVESDMRREGLIVLRGTHLQRA